MSEINFNNPVSSIKRILNQNKKISKIALKNVLKVIKAEQKIIDKKRKKEEKELKDKMELEMKMKKEMEDESEEADLSFVIDNVGTNIKKEENDAENEVEKEVEGSKMLSNDDQVKIEEEQKMKIENIDNEKVEAEVEVEEEEEEEEEDEEEEVVEEDDTSLPGLFLEIKAGTKEQTVLDSLDQVCKYVSTIARTKYLIIFEYLYFSVTAFLVILLLQFIFH